MLKQQILNYFYSSIDILKDYINGYTILSLVLFYIIGFLWKRFYPVGFLQKTIYYLWFFLLLPGTIAHEFMHFIMGVFLKARPVGFSLLPKKTENGYVLGSVSFKNLSFWNVLPVSMAPLLLLPLYVYFLVYFLVFFLENNIRLFFAGYFVYNLWVSSVPSITDFKLLFKYPLGIIFYGIIILSFIKLKQDGGF